MDKVYLFMARDPFDWDTHTVEKAFKSRESAEAYMKENPYGYISEQEISD